MKNPYSVKRLYWYCRNNVLRKIGDYLYAFDPSLVKKTIKASKIDLKTLTVEQVKIRDKKEHGQGEVAAGFAYK